MIIYNVTINLDESIHEKWLQWMKEKHIQEVLNTGKFISARMVKVMVDQDLEGQTYSIQYLAENRTKLESYYLEDAPRLRQEGQQLFGDKMLAFRTELEVLEDFFA
jgi:hypothetical protein